MILLKQDIDILLSLLPDNTNFSPESMQHEITKDEYQEVEHKRKLVKLVSVLQEHSAGSAMDQGRIT